MMQHTYTNRLIHASSPYLQQHAHNPVDWYEWGDEPWQKARNEDKLVLVSIGYSACHWCHVMERESFENPDTAAIMNEYFVCIKVDREERPDVDQVYMDAVQLITQHGGWPLNMFCLPDGRPLHGGTYFPNRDWNQLLFQLHNFYANKKAEAEDFATKLVEGVKGMDALNVVPAIEKFTTADIDAIYNLWKPQFDWKEGGNNRVPKFPLSNNFQFLFNYHLLAENKEAGDFVNLTLEKIARGGIYDQLGGGFARYSTDGEWLVPHFEKMLYDNGQLVSLCANAYKSAKNIFYKEVIDHTLEFIAREMTSPDGSFYSALDADSEGVEGKFYVWSKQELKDILGDDEPLFSEYYNVTEKGNWEHGINILHCKEGPESFANKKGLKEIDFKELLDNCHKKLMAVRDKRIRPGLDDKIICGWNALMLKGYAHAYLATGTEKYLQSALKNKYFIEAHFLKDNRLQRIHKEGKTTINAFIEDYASVIDAYTQLYQCTFDAGLLITADKLAKTALDEFYNAESGLFYFTSRLDPPLAVRKTDTADDVISSGNSIMAENLYKLAYYFGNTEYKSIAETMLAKMEQYIKKYPSWYSNWANLAMVQAYGLYQIVIIGENAQELYGQFTSFIPNAVFAVSKNGKEPLTLFENRCQPGKTLIYICKNETCALPVESVKEVMEKIC